MIRIVMALVLCTAVAVNAETRREGDSIFLSAPGASWELKDEQRRDNGTGGYYLYQNAGTGLLFPVYLEPAVSCRTVRQSCLH